MAAGITYGLNFPFQNSSQGDYLQLTELESEEIKADLIHLLLTITLYLKPTNMTQLSTYFPR